MGEWLGKFNPSALEKTASLKHLKPLPPLE
jgi:hypothetical protein